MKSIAIVLAAGQGKRMHSKVQKQFLSLKGKPILYYSLTCFQNSPVNKRIIYTSIFTQIVIRFNTTRLPIESLLNSPTIFHAL